MKISIERVTALTAVIGCATGVIALAWQVWDYKESRVERLLVTATVSLTFTDSDEQTEIGLRRLRVAEDLALLGLSPVITATVTNLGSHDIYLRDVFLRQPVEGDFYRAHIYTSDTPLGDPLAPGEPRGFSFALDPEESQRVFDPTTSDITIEVTTSRETHISELVVGKIHPANKGR